ncbi:PorT family protein [Chryseobacterium gallinarum]|uniref:porin family protein n=1 Tax=Chryseobacterium gallinarum TaxID=1324352 RepID=UPI0020244AFA|nr:porin family protein [Chryseobacterium gallinarum]MCL8536239.1 PorT family protein [Chryseobacterium gallinarum]
MSKKHNMNSEWLNNLHRRMEDHEMEVPDGLWDDIRDELFSEEHEMKGVAGLSTENNTKNNAAEHRQKSRNLMYRIGGMAAVVAGLVFLVMNLFPEKNDKPLSGLTSDLQKERRKNGLAENLTNNVKPEARTNPDISLTKNSLAETKAGNIAGQGYYKTVLKKENKDNDGAAREIIAIQEIAKDSRKEIQIAQKQTGADEVSGKEAKEEIFKQEKYTDNKKNPVTSKAKKSWMLGMLTGNVSSNTAEQQFPGYASMNGKPMTVEQVWSTSAYEDDPLTAVLLANQSQPVEAKIRHRIPVTFGLSLYYSLGKKWGIGTGLNYTKLVSDLHSGSTANYIKGQQTVHYIGIPVQVNYNVIRKGKFTGYVTGGALVEKPVSGSLTTTYIVNDEVKETSKEHLDDKPLQFSVNTAVGLQLKVIDRFGVYAEPGIGYHFKDDRSPNTIYKEKPLQFNLKFGVRILLD